MSHKSRICEQGARNTLLDIHSSYKMQATYWRVHGSATVALPIEYNELI